MDIKENKRLLWAILFSIVFSVILLWRIEWTHFSLIAGRLDIKYLIAAYGVFLAGNLVRTFRFIRLDHTNKKLLYWWNVNAFYNFITATLPGGLGEAATAHVLKRFSEFNILGAFRILLICRFMDLLALSALFFLASVCISIVTPYREAAIWLSIILFLVASIALIPASENIILRLLLRFPRNNIYIQKISEKLNDLLEIAKERRGASFYAITLIQSVIEKMAGVAVLHMLLQSFGIYFSPVQSVYSYGVYMVFQIIPVQGIAGIGTQAAWWTLALNAAGYKAPDAIASGFILYGTFYLFIALMGLFSLLLWFKGREKR